MRTTAPTQKKKPAKMKVKPTFRFGEGPVSPEMETWMTKGNKGYGRDCLLLRPADGERRMSAKKSARGGLPGNLYIGKVRVVEGYHSETNKSLDAYADADGDGMSFGRQPGPMIFCEQVLGHKVALWSENTVENFFEDWCYENIYILPTEETE